MAHDVFISYSSKDKPIADAVCATLEGSKIRCWIAPRDVLPGVPYGEALINALNQSRLLVLVFSADANNSPQVMREVERAVNKNIPIIPFRIENVLPSKSMEFFLGATHWLDAMTPPLERHLQKLNATVQAIISGTANLNAARPEQDSFLTGSAVQTMPEKNSGRVEVRKTRFNVALRIIGGVLGITFLISGAASFSSQAVGLITGFSMVIMGIIACFTAFLPQWTSSRLRINLENSIIFSFILVGLTALFFVAILFFESYKPA